MPVGELIEPGMAGREQGKREREGLTMALSRYVGVGQGIHTP